MPRLLSPPGKEPLVPIGQEAGQAPEPFWMGGGDMERLINYNSDK